MEMQKEFLGCVSCAGAIPITPANRAPEFSVNEKTGQIIETKKNDMADFLIKHRECPLEKLSVVDGPWSHQSFQEPVREDFYHVATQNNERLLLRRWRDDINQPFQYQLLKGRVTTRILQISFAEQEIKKQLLKEGPNLPEWKIDDLIEGMKNILEQEEESIKEEFINNFYILQKNGALVDTAYPLQFWLALDPLLVERVKDLVRRLYHRPERLFLEDFIDRHNNPNGVLGLQINTDFQVIQRAKIAHKPLKESTTQT